MDEPALAGENVANLHLVRAAVVDESLVEAGSVQMFGGLLVVARLS
jgi:hypothetical protein